MTKTINMNIEVKNIILDLKRLGKTSGQISKTLSILSPEMVCTNSSEELTVGATRGNREHGILQKATENC